MSDVVIRAQGLGKAYALGEGQARERYLALRDVMTEALRSGWRKARMDPKASAPPSAPPHAHESRAAGADFWALQDVGFEIRRGEVVGIIGRNGAGKSTLLKILSRITEPSAGRVELRGRVASLLEVGTGFHPELTGRENVFLNGAILGMTQREIRARFDEIVAFADVERFLDTPVKRYSSGMYMRLAFAVAAHLEPEILVVDEVLAVGDAEFQKKCLGKMQDVASGGRTVLFVSHNMAAVQALCGRGLLLQGGRLTLDADARGAVEAYMAAPQIENTEIGFEDCRLQVKTRLTDDESELFTKVSIWADRGAEISHCHFFITSALGMRCALIDLRPHLATVSWETGKQKTCNFTLRINLAPLSPDTYRLGLFIETMKGAQDFHEVGAFCMSRPSGLYPAQYQGPVRIQATVVEAGQALDRLAGLE